MKRGRDRLELELDVAKTLGARGGLELPLGGAVGGVVTIDEEDRAPQHDLVRHAAGLLFEPLLEVAQEAADQSLERHAGAADLRGFLHQAAAEDRLQRPHEAPVGALHVLVDGRSAEMHAAILEAEEERGGEGHLIPLDRDQERSAACGAQTHGGVGGPEIDTTMKAAHGSVSQGASSGHKTAHQE